MKTTFTLLVSLLGFVNLAFAGVITVSNRPGDSAQFSSLQDAINSASAGDSIYISGSLQDYGSAVISQKLTLIGPGFNPNKEQPLKASIYSIVLDTGSDGSAFVGLIIQQSISANYVEVNDILVSRCEVGGIYAYSTDENNFQANWVVENCIVYYIWSQGFNGNHNWLIINNLIRDSVYDINFSQISNNVFHNSNNPAFYLTEFCVIANNILYNSNPTGVENSTFSNNLSFGGFTPDIPYGSNGGLGNIVGQNPLFVNVPDVNFSHTYDYSLQAGSPGIDAGIDGTDMGLFGGNGFIATGEPSLPVVTVLTILNPIVPLNGQISVQVQGRANK